MLGIACMCGRVRRSRLMGLVRSSAARRGIRGLRGLRALRGGMVLMVLTALTVWMALTAVTALLVRRALRGRGCSLRARWRRMRCCRLG